MRVGTPNYAEKSDDELLALATEAGSLTAEARDALRLELKDRKLDSPTAVAKFSDEQNRFNLADEMSRLGLSWRGNGRRAYGKSNTEVSGLNEEYDTTIFVVVSYFPLIPTGTYRVCRQQGAGEFRAVAEKPLNWAQITWTWTKSLAVVAALPIAFRLLDALTSPHR
ncbi:MAG TPA: hypothetical protein VJO35_08265 [Terriglobales bacterium]|nr:hypothetical protein [Terriglobales bacterium]